MTLEQLFLAYIVVLLLTICALGIYYEFRRKRFAPAQSADHIFRCADCGLVYTDDPDVDRSRCPQCGKLNEVYNF